ncbi:MAG: ImmA/IrrE family metallo-endopeptidase [Planctomycetota bacterium]
MVKKYGPNLRFASKKAIKDLRELYDQDTNILQAPRTPFEWASYLRTQPTEAIKYFGIDRREVTMLPPGAGDSGLAMFDPSLGENGTILIKSRDSGYSSSAYWEESVRFSEAHELGHAQLHKHEGPNYRGSPDYNSTLEPEANAYAATFLMPEKLLRQLILVLFRKWQVDGALHAHLFDRDFWDQITIQAANYSVSPREDPAYRATLMLSHALAPLLLVSPRAMRIRIQALHLVKD